MRIFVLVLFNSTVNKIECMTLTGGLVNEPRIGRDLQRSDCGFVSCCSLGL